MSIANGTKYERKFLAHFIDDTFGTGTTRNYKRLGKDLEEYTIEMNPDVDTKKNILGESSANVKGYEPSGSVDTYYAYEGDALFNQLYSIINNRSTGSALETTVIDAVLEYGDGTITVANAYKEDVVVVPQSIGGEDGVQIPFEIHYTGNRTTVSGTIDSSSGNFVISNG